MDPNVTLSRLRELADNNDVEWANLFESLDDWLSKGGFLPEAWAVDDLDRNRGSRQ